MKALIYQRKSTDREDRQMLSIIAQERECKKLSTQHSEDVFEKFSESKSAKKPFQRTEFDKMIKIIRSNPGVFSLVCWTLDRLARNMEEGGIIMQMLQDGVIRKVISSEGIFNPSDELWLMATSPKNNNKRDNRLRQLVFTG